MRSISLFSSSIVNTDPMTPFYRVKLQKDFMHNLGVPCNATENPRVIEAENQNSMHIEGVLGIMLPIIITLGAFVMVVYIRKFDNLERMAIIDKGLSPDLFKRDKKESTSPVLRW